MKKFWRTASQSVHVPLFDKAEDTLRAMTASGRALFLLFAGLCALSTVGLFFVMETRLVVASPAYGGWVSEGLLGSPRFINPVLAITDADRDLVGLVYSGLLHALPGGGYEPDLASSYTVSEDGLVYTVTLREDATFHDGSPFTADDVVFTVEKTQNPSLKSPLRAAWSGVVVEALSEHTVRFTLKSPYAPFIANLTLGILPKERWQNATDEEFPFSQLNTLPVGSGPFMVRSVSRSPSGIPTAYELEPFSGYALGQPYLSRLILRFYQSEKALIEALRAGDIDSGSGISPANLGEIDPEEITSAPLNRIFGVFFNQNQSEVLRAKEVRAALDMAVDRNALIEQVLGGWGTALDGPVPPTLALSAERVRVSSGEDLPLRARAYLLERGWKEGEFGLLSRTVGSGKNASSEPLAFTLATGNVPELRAAAEFLKSVWHDMGAQVTIEIYEQGDLSQNVIRPRKYDALLFGEVVGRELDLFAFWDSSQRNDPGLNIALYANAKADKALGALRQTEDPRERAELYQQFKAELDADIPALFLYAPDFVYSISKDIKGVVLGFIETPSDRFLSVRKWHREVDWVWPFFVSNKEY